MDAHEIITIAEEIAADLAELEQILQKEDDVLAHVLCKQIAKVFWELEVPVTETHPSLRSLVVVGEKYKKCIFKIVKHDRKTRKLIDLKTGILPEDARAVFAEIKSKMAEDTESSLKLEVEHCYGAVWPEWHYKTKIASKITAAFIIKKLGNFSGITLSVRARSLLENKEMNLMFEQIEIKRFIGWICGEIFTSIYYSIYRAYPSLVQEHSLDKRHEGCTYSVLEYNLNSGASIVKISGVLPEKAFSTLAEAENRFPQTSDSFLGLEIEEKQ